jgi:hypothetical protein
MPEYKLEEERDLSLLRATTAHIIHKIEGVPKRHQPYLK